MDTRWLAAWLPVAGWLASGAHLPGEPATVAAATTSLPEALGGDKRPDYRVAWLRDVRLTIRRLSVATCSDEAGPASAIQRTARAD